MKRVLLMVTAFIALSSSASAIGNEELAVFSKLNEKTNFDGLANYLNATYEQKEYLKEIFAQSTKKMEKAMTNGSVSDKDAKKAVTFNLANTKDVLSPDQYRKYLTVINITLNHIEKQDLLTEK